MKYTFIDLPISNVPQRRISYYSEWKPQNERNMLALQENDYFGAKALILFI